MRRDPLKWTSLGLLPDMESSVVPESIAAP
jgi:hypothetical protein